MNRFLIAILLALVVSGCGGKKDDGRPPVFPARGSVVSKGKSLDGAMLLFHPKDSKLKDVRCYAKTEPDGTFKVSTYDAGDGAPEGEFTVTITWPTVSVEDGGYGEDRFQGKFNNPQTTPFKATITKPSTELPAFEVPQ